MENSQPKRLKHCFPTPALSGSGVRDASQSGFNLCRRGQSTRPRAIANQTLPTALALYYMFVL